jgi:uncharacterized protein YdeI (YjbR/CyaY-like superfamily)
MLEIGITTIEYNEDTTVKIAKFTPTMEVSIPDELLQKLKESGEWKDPEKLKENSDFIFASWFSKMNDIELADREVSEIVSEIIVCEKYPNGNIKKCSMKYIFKEI